jgi:hypothetical protein
MLREHPDWSVGVHLTITSEWNRLRWRPVSPITVVPSLVAPDGYLWGFGYSGPRPKNWAADGAPWAEHAPNPQEAEKEFRAQIERALSLGVKLDYVDCHMGMACREDLLPITKKLAAEYCLGISGAGGFHEKRAQPRYPDDTRAGIKAGLLEMIEGLTPGLCLGGTARRRFEQRRTLGSSAQFRAGRLDRPGGARKHRKTRNYPRLLPRTREGSSLPRH